MKVYVLMHEDLDSNELIVLYSSKEFADLALKKLDDRYFIFEEEVLEDSSIPLYGIK